jgi:outer membrane usher protein
MLETSIRNLRWTSFNSAAAFLIWVIFIPCATAADSGISSADQPIRPLGPMPSTSAPTTSAAFKERLLLVDINQQQLNQTVMMLEDQAGLLYLWSSDLQRWRLRQPDIGTAITYQGEQYFPLSSILGVSNKYDPEMLTLMIDVRPEAFTKTTRTTQHTDMPPPVKPGSGGFINYDLFVSRSFDSTQRSGLFELGYFNRFGVGTSNILANQLGRNSGTTRLDTTWTTDFPNKLQTLRVGDAVSSPGSWGRAVRLGGVQFGSNFGTQPDFLTYPTQIAVGAAALPSTVDVFINNALVSHQSVPPGPFSISNLPIVSGGGDVRLVVRDLLGRDQIITRPFYASQTLLREGLVNFSTELGMVRNNFGINSNDYGSWLASGTYRRGMSDQFTGEVHSEVMQGQATVGSGGDYLIPKLGVISSYVAGSHRNLNNGRLMLLGLDRQANPWSFGAHVQWASSGFTQIGIVLPLSLPAQMSSYNLSYAGKSNGSVGIAYVSQHFRNQDDTRIAILSYGASLGRTGSYSISMLRNLTVDMSTTLFALLSFTLDVSTNLSASAQSVRGGNGAIHYDFSTTLQRNLPLGEGYGYRLQARSGGANQASYSLQNNVGTYTTETAQNQGYNTTRLGVAGGIAVLGGDAFLSRRIDQSFAVARIPDYPNVHVLVDNQPAGKTNANGNALIPRLRAYDINLITIDQRDIPLDAEIDTIRLHVVPYYRSGIAVTFPIKRSFGATLTIILDNGKPLPVGASVQQVGKKGLFTVGYRGEVYLVGLDPTNRLRAIWRNQTCEFEVRFTASSNPLPDLGTFLCTGVKP